LSNPALARAIKWEWRKAFRSIFIDKAAPESIK